MLPKYHVRMHDVRPSNVKRNSSPNKENVSIYQTPKQAVKILPYVSIITQDAYRVWCKTDKKLFESGDLQADIFICFTYIPPKDSSYLSREKRLIFRN